MVGATEITTDSGNTSRGYSGTVGAGRRMAPKIPRGARSTQYLHRGELDHPQRGAPVALDLVIRWPGRMPPEVRPRRATPTPGHLAQVIAR